MQRTISPADEIQRRRFSESECDGGLQRASTTAAKTPRLRPVGRKAARPKAPELGVHVDAGGPYTDVGTIAVLSDPPGAVFALFQPILRESWQN